ncbi:MAG: tRNA (cytidine(34)-2'-O)-methyltransferase [Verrucomicrobiota bacterium]|nr:tRNA (cytidine(34)-2'-O)-methyltransferase [Verrucomicrobiota bacterium]
MFNIVLINPEIPQNTGNIGRLCVSTDSVLHLIKPLGFSLDEKAVKRAGLDYWQYLNLKVHDSWEDFLSGENPSELFFASTKGSKLYFDYKFSGSDYLIFGSEGGGLPENFYSKYSDSLYIIPMSGKESRSLNLANSVSIILYEGIRQTIIL